MTNHQQKPFQTLDTRGAMSDKTNGEQTSKRPTALINFDEMVRRANAFYDDLSEAFKEAMKPYGVEIANVRVLWRPVDSKLRETLSTARLVPEVKVVVAKHENELPKLGETRRG